MNKIWVWMAIMPGVHGAYAAICDSGYYLNEDKCAPCQYTSNPGYYCPGDDTRHICPPQTGEMAKIYEKLSGDKVALINSTTWTPNDRLVDDVHLCISSVNMVTDTGSYYYTSGYYDGEKYGDTSYRLWFTAGPGYYLSPYSHTTLGDWYHGVKACTNAPSGARYTGAGTPDAPDGSTVDANDCPWECDAGYGRHGDECLPLCAAGATKLHAGDFSFNIYRGDICAVPAIRLGLGGDECCVNLAPDNAPGAINIMYGGNPYHTIN